MDVCRLEDPEVLGLRGGALESGDSTNACQHQNTG